MVFWLCSRGNQSERPKKKAGRKGAKKKIHRRLGRKKGEIPRSKIALGYGTLVFAKIAVVFPVTARGVVFHFFLQRPKL